MIKFYLFDIDGTLLDVFDQHIAAYKDAIQSLYNKSCNVEDLTNSFGLPEEDCYREAVRSLNISPSQEEIKKLKELRSQSMIKRLSSLHEDRLLPGVRKLLDFLSQQAQIGFITGNSSQVGKALLEFSGLNTYSKFSAFGDEIPTGEQRSYLIHQLLQQANVNSDETWVIGDSVHDIIAAKEAGCVAVGVATYKTGKDALIKAGADLAFADCQEMYDSLQD
ncbi:HAD family hydrolase [Nanoarchaeota archaeon]